jgi:RecB family endonuclease NucS
MLMLNIDDYSMLIENALKKTHSIVLGCKCDVAYSGRAESFLPRGDRIILIKEDNALIVHQPTGNNPVNYMKPNSNISVCLEGGKLILRAKNLNQKEFMDINIENVHFFQSSKLQDGQQIELKGTEKDMADMIMQTPALIEKGFIPVNQEEQTKYGFIDVLGRDKADVLTVVECKRFKADLSAVSQLRRYVEKIKSSKGVENIRGILAAPAITSNAEKMLTDWGFNFVVVHPPKYLERYDKKQQRLHHFTSSDDSDNTNS